MDFEKIRWKPEGDMKLHRGEAVSYTHLKKYAACLWTGLSGGNDCQPDYAEIPGLLRKCKNGEISEGIYGERAV